MLLPSVLVGFPETFGWLIVIEVIWNSLCAPEPLLPQYQPHDFLSIWKSTKSPVQAQKDAWNCFWKVPFKKINEGKQKNTKFWACSHPVPPTMYYFPSYQSFHNPTPTPMLTTPPGHQYIVCSCMLEEKAEPIKSLYCSSLFCCWFLNIFRWNSIIWCID